MKFSHSILYVKDVAETLKFYKEAFGFETKFTTPENDYGELASGETAIGFVSTELANSNLKKGFQQSSLQEKPFGAELTFVTEDIEDDFAKAIKAGAIAVEPIEEKVWGQKICYLRDNNGFLIELGTPMEE